MDEEYFGGQSLDPSPRWTNLRNGGTFRLRGLRISGLDSAAKSTDGEAARLTAQTARKMRLDLDMKFGADRALRSGSSRFWFRLKALSSGSRCKSDSNQRDIIRSAAKRSTGDADAVRKAAAEEGHVEKIFERDALIQRIRELKQAGQRIVFTNGCFDILHPGHIRFLQEARRLGDTLVVGVNSDRSVRDLKGPQRPILTAARTLPSFCRGWRASATSLCLMNPHRFGLIQAVLPHVLVKGGDWGLTEIVGREEVEADGGTVTSLPYEKGQSTSGIIERILSRYRP